MLHLFHYINTLYLLLTSCYSRFMEGICFCYSGLSFLYSIILYCFRYSYVHARENNPIRDKIVAISSGHLLFYITKQLDTTRVLIGQNLWTYNCFIKAADRVFNGFYRRNKPTWGVARTWEKLINHDPKSINLRTKWTYFPKRSKALDCD